ncbi:hypothetical protein ACWEHA_02775 [Amycolatopsis nivea]
MFARMVWSATVVCTSVLCGFGIVLVPAAVLAGIAGAILLVVCFGWLCAEGTDWGRRRFAHGPSARWAAARCTAALTASCLVAATVAMLAGTVLACVATGGLLAAGVWSGWRVRTGRPTTSRRRQRGKSTPVEDVRPCPDPVDSLPLDQLCLLWRRSFLELQRAADERTRHAVVAARQAYLDELERRDRPGFARWLDSGARAAGDPSRYVRPAE